MIKASGTLLGRWFFADAPEQGPNPGRSQTNGDGNKQMLKASKGCCFSGEVTRCLWQIDAPEQPIDRAPDRDEPAAPCQSQVVSCAVQW